MEFGQALAGSSPKFNTSQTSGEDDAFLYYTSGTTGPAKGVVHTHNWIAGVAATQRFISDLEPEDLYWSTGSLGWFRGAMTTLGAWFWGIEMFNYEGEFDPESCVKLLNEHPITVFFAVPTTYQLLRNKEEKIQRSDINLRRAFFYGRVIGRNAY